MKDHGAKRRDTRRRAFRPGLAHVSDGLCVGFWRAGCLEARTALVQSAISGVRLHDTPVKAEDCRYPYSKTPAGEYAPWQNQALTGDLAAF